MNLYYSFDWGSTWHFAGTFSNSELEFYKTALFKAGYAVLVLRADELASFPEVSGLSSRV
jgi:hypothetical protein